MSKMSCPIYEYVQGMSSIYQLVPGHPAYARARAVHCTPVTKVPVVQLQAWASERPINGQSRQTGFTFQLTRVSRSWQ
jgi:hypothetical protein